MVAFALLVLLLLMFALLLLLLDAFGLPVAKMKTGGVRPGVGVGPMVTTGGGFSLSAIVWASKEASLEIRYIVFYLMLFGYRTIRA